MAASLRGPHATTAESRDGARRPVSTGLVKRDTNNDPYTHHLPARTPPTPSNLSGDTRAVIGNRNPRFRVGCAWFGSHHRRCARSIMIARGGGCRSASRRADGTAIQNGRASGRERVGQYV